MSTSILATIVGLISGSLSFVLDVALIVVALTVVRKRRADAGILIAASAGLQLFTTVVIRIVYALLLRTMGASSYAEMSLAIQLGGAFASAIAMVLLILGIVKLASDTPTTSSPY